MMWRLLCWLGWHPDVTTLTSWLGPDGWVCARCGRRDWPE